MFAMLYRSRTPVGCPGAQLAQPSPIAGEFVERGGKEFGFVWVVQDAAPGLADDLDKRAVARLHDRRAVRHGFKEGESFRVGVRARHREDVDGLKKCDLPRAIGRAFVFHVQ